MGVTPQCTHPGHSSLPGQAEEDNIFPHVLHSTAHITHLYTEQERERKS